MGTIFERKFKMTREENIFLAKRNIVDYIWKSVNLEGIGMTYPDTQAVYNGMSVAGFTIDEINTVNDLKNAWKQVLDTLDDPLDLEYIKRIHSTLGKFTILNRGSLRLDDVWIGGTDWQPEKPNREKVESEIRDINSIGDPIGRALHITAYLMRRQLFYDGNKRIAMLIGNKVMIDNGCGIISVRQKDIDAFYSILVPFYETGDYTQIEKFLYENCIDGMNFTRQKEPEEK